MDRIYQVFVSSTYSDLQEERRAVSDTLAKAGFIPAGMELFPATDQKQLEFIKRVIDRCDYYVVIVGGRYGSLADEDVSFTEKEYNYALERGMPILAFLHKDPNTIEAGKTELDLDQRKRLDHFRTRLAASRIIDYWASSENLCTNVLTAVTQTVNLSPGIGWIRGDQAIDPKVVQDMERLRIENSELRRKLTDIQASPVTFPSDVPGPDKPFECVVTVTRKSRSGKEFDPSSNAPEAHYQFDASFQLGQIFIHLYDYLINAPRENYLGERIGWVIADLSGRDERGVDFTIAPQKVKEMRFRLEALGLIRIESYQGSMFSSAVLWTITDKARQYVSRHFAASSTAVESR